MAAKKKPAAKAEPEEQPALDDKPVERPTKSEVKRAIKQARQAENGVQASKIALGQLEGDIRANRELLERFLALMEEKEKADARRSE